MAWLENNDNSFCGYTVLPQIGEAVAYLRGRDEVLDDLIDRQGPCTLKPCHDYFSVLVETVISQQLSTRVAKTIYGRLVKLAGKRCPRPGEVLEMTNDMLTGIGLSRSKAAYIKNVAQAFQGKRMGPKRFEGMDDEEIHSFLTSIKGIGEWSAHMFLIFALNRLDVFPLGDLGLRNAIARSYRLRKPPSLRRLEQIGSKWRPYRTIGTWYLWESYDNG